MKVDEAVPTGSLIPTGEPSPFDQADPELLRAMVELGGRVLDDLAADVPAPRTLRDLCDSCRAVLDASRVTVELTPDPARGSRTLLPPDELTPIPPARAPGTDHRFTTTPGPRAASDDHRFGTAPLPAWAAGAGEQAELAPVADGGFRTEATGPCWRPDGAEIAYRLGITGPGGQPAGWLEAAWPVGHGRPTELDMAVVARFSRLAVLVVARQQARRDQLRALARDRQDLAGEIHDDPIQTMTAVALRLQRVLSKLGDGPEHEAVAEARALTDQAIDRLRHVMFSLHPATLDEDGLAAALDAYCEAYVEPEGLTCTVEATGEEPVAAEIAALAFRLARGALVNVVKHARAGEVRVRLMAGGGLLRVTVADDGTGFDTSALGHTPVGHFGIAHSASLARSAGGTYRTASTPGSGTTVTIELPLG